MARNRFSDTIRFFRGFILSRPKIDDPSFSDNRSAPADYATLGSRNVLFMGRAKPRPFKGLELVEDQDGGTLSSQVSDGVGALTDKAP